MSSNTKYDKGKRTEMVSQKLRCMEQICEEMKINWTGDKLLALQKSEPLFCYAPVSDPSS